MVLHRWVLHAETRGFTPHATLARVKVPDPSLFTVLRSLEGNNLWRLHHQRDETQEEHPHPAGTGVRRPAGGCLGEAPPPRRRGAHNHPSDAGGARPCLRACKTPSCIDRRRAEKRREWWWGPLPGIRGCGATGISMFSCSSIPALPGRNLKCRALRSPARLQVPLPDTVS